ncbi:MAG: hypothetical protein ACI9W4_001886 [Rhodothermales bacterium]|jgi:hypothetical protein
MRAFFTISLLLAFAPLASAQGLRFEDVTDQAGMTMDSRGHGVAARDYDRDGWPDLFVASANGAGKLFRNRGNGTFEDATERAGLDVIGLFAPAWADIDNDGWADLIVVGKTAQNKVYRSRGDGTFEDISATSGIDVDAAAASLAFGDFDADGLIDVFFPVEGDTDLLYRNVGGGVFEDVSGRAGIGGSKTTVAMQATWFDFDHDGTQDLFVVHDGFAESRLHRNYGFLPLIDQATSTGFANIGSGNSMGVTWGDVDGDGWEDVYVTRIGEAGLYINQQGNGFVQIEDALGAWRNGMSWGTTFADFDNDGDNDLFVVSTSGYDGTETILYENRNGWFVDQSQSANASRRVETQGLAALDLDRNGLMDLVYPDHNGQVRVLKGTTQEPGNWLRIELEGVQANRDAIGARIEVYIGDQVLTRYVSGGDSYCSQSEPAMLLGLGDATQVDQIVVRWGGGASEFFGAQSAGNYRLTQGSGTAAGVAIAPSEIPRGNPALSAFPNPFAADTRITVSLPTAQHVRVTLHDALGREVYRLVNGTLPAGLKEFSLADKGLSTGIYFVRMETQSGVTTTAVSKIR